MSPIKNHRDTIASLVNEDVQNLQSYHVPDATGMLKLDAMESPYVLPDVLRQQWLKRLDDIQINRYPDATAAALKKTIRSVFSISQKTGLILGNGSDELIQLLVLLVGGVEKVVMTPTPSFSMYQQICIATTTKFVGVPLKADFSLDDIAFMQAIKMYQPACIFLSYPNNPTGNCFQDEAIKSILNCAPGLVVLDEAYFSFCQKSYLTEIKNHPNLIILRTLSKSGFAGLRLGMMMGHQDWMAECEKLRLPYNVNSLSQHSALFLLEHDTVFLAQTNKIKNNRAWLFHEMGKISGVEVFPSSTNFLLFRVEGYRGNLMNDFKQKNILIKSLDKTDAMLSNCFRVTVGARSECALFLQVLSELLYLK